MQSHSEAALPPLGHLPLQVDETEAAPSPPKQALHAETPVQTSAGVQRLTALKVGDHVMTRSGTLQPITRIDHTVFTKRQLQTMPEAAPIRFDPGALPGLPEDIETLVSPDCPIAWSENDAKLERFPAHAFCDGGLIRSVIPDEGIHYIRLQFATAHQICVGGIWIELSPDDTKVVEFPQRAPKLIHEIRVFRPLRS